MQAIAGWILIGIGALVSAGNLSLIVRWIVKRKGGSLVPLLGGPLVLIGCAITPGVGWTYGLVGVVGDPGCAWLCACLFRR